jgi:C4-dicarboxylate-specific signal transduction histidine kinase
LKNKYFLFLFFILNNSFSQDITLANFEIKRTDIENKIYSNQKQAFTEAKSLVAFAKKTKSKQLLANALSCLSYIEMGLSDFENSYKHNTESFNYNKSVNNQKELACNYFNFSKINIRKADFENCLRNSLLSIDYATKTKNIVLIQRVYNTLAVSYYLQKDFEKGVDYGKKALELQKKTTNYETKGYSLGTIALNNWEIYCKTKDETYFIQSEIDFKKAVSIFTKYNDTYNLGWALSNWSYIYQKKDIEKCLTLKLSANENFENTKTENYGTLTNLGNIAITYDMLSQNDSLIKTLKNKNIPNKKEILETKAEYYYSKCNEVCLRLKSLAYYQNMLRKYAAFQHRKSKNNEAYKNIELSYKINDSIFSQEKKNAIAKLESQKELDKKNHQIKLDKLTIENKEKQKRFYILGLGLLFIIGCLLFYQSIKTKQTNEKLKLLNTELDQANKAKTRFFSILNHDLRSPVANLVHFLQLQKESPEMLDEESIKRMQDKTMAGAENLLNSMEDILQWSKSQMENFKPQPKEIAINSLFEDTKIHFSSEDKVKIYFENTQNIQINTDENYLKTIIRNLTGNAIKALNNIENPTIIWKAWQENKICFLSITDNGSGASKEQFKALYDDKEVVGIEIGLGLHLIRDLAKAINCEIIVESKINEGTTFIIKI